MRSPSGRAPVGDAGPRAGGDQHGVGVELLDAGRRLDDAPGAARRAGPCPWSMRTRWLPSSSVDASRSAGSTIASTRSFSAVRSTWPSTSVEAHALDAAGEGHRPAGGDHRLRRDAVPQVGGAADDLALDHRDVGAEAGRVGGGGGAGRAAADDHEAAAPCRRGYWRRWATRRRRGRAGRGSGPDCRWPSARVAAPPAHRRPVV